MSTKSDEYPWRDEATLRELYHDRKMSLSQVADELGCDHHTVVNWMDKHDISRRGLSEGRLAVTPDLEERFWSKVDRGGEDECWEWQAVRRGGYGRIRVDGRLVSANRLAYELTYRDPGENDVLHHCDNPPCVNPNHLYLGDMSDNMNDAYERGRKEPLCGALNGRAKLTEDQARQVKQKIAAGGQAHQELADEYGVSISAIHHISEGRTWENLNDEDDGTTQVSLGGE